MIRDKIPKPQARIKIALMGFFATGAVVSFMSMAGGAYFILQNDPVHGLILVFLGLFGLFVVSIGTMKVKYELEEGHY